MNHLKGSFDDDKHFQNVFHCFVYFLYIVLFILCSFEAFLINLTKYKYIMNRSCHVMHILTKEKSKNIVIIIFVSGYTMG